MTAIFYGVSPAVIALILHSCWRLGKLGMEDWFQWAVAGVSFVVTVVAAGRGGDPVHRRRRVRHSLLRLAVPRRSPPAALALSPRRWSLPAAQRSARRRPRRCRCSPSWCVLPQGRQPDLRQRSRHRAVPGEGPGAADRLAEPARVPGRSRDRHAEPRPGGDHRDVRRLSGRRLLGLAGRDRSASSCRRSCWC